MQVPFLDLKAQYATIKPQLDAAVLGVLESGQFVLGPAVADFEARFAAYCGVDHAVAVNSGTSALHLALLAAGVGPGDEVVTVSMTFVATTAAILYAGATPVFVDIDRDAWTMDPAAVEAAITPRTKAIMPVHLHGRPADMDAILAVADAHGLPVIEDAAQAHGAELGGRRAGSMGLLGCFSFYPGKNLGACGEGGAVVTRDAALADKMRMLRDWGQAKKYDHVLAGYNYRMEGIQGAALGVKMGFIEAWTEQRRAAAAAYDTLLAPTGLRRASPPKDGRHVYHVYAVSVPDRARVQAALTAAGVATGIHYPVPVHLQKAYAGLGYRAGDLPVTEALAAQTLSLPMFPEITAEQVGHVCTALAEATQAAAV